jgi:hypothetical protein
VKLQIHEVEGTSGHSFGGGHQQHVVLDYLTINKLGFDRLTALYGRNKEIQLLVELVSARQKRRQLIVISGAAGTRKSILAISYKCRFERQPAFFWLTGRFKTLPLMLVTVGGEKN